MLHPCRVVGLSAGSPTLSKVLTTKNGWDVQDGQGHRLAEEPRAGRVAP